MHLEQQKKRFELFEILDSNVSNEVKLQLIILLCAHTSRPKQTLAFLIHSSIICLLKTLSLLLIFYFYRACFALIAGTRRM